MGENLSPPATPKRLFTGQIGRISKIMGPVIHVQGIANAAKLGDRVRIYGADGPDHEPERHGHIIALSDECATVFCDEATTGMQLGQRVRHLPRLRLFPCDAWLGRVVDPYGQALDKRPLAMGPTPRDTANSPPTARRGLGQRIATGYAALNTFLPLVQGQRVGVFAGSGVGKSTLLGHLAQHIAADVIVLALIGERSREVYDFAQNILGPEAMQRCVIIAATSDMPATYRAQAAFSAMTVAEYFRDQGHHVVLFADSITRLAEAHREIAAHCGELPVLRGYPPSLTAKITELAERAGPGGPNQGDITAVFSVLVAGSDMDEPVADIMRGVLDGHIILDRTIAERGRFPAIDLTRSVSRALPHAASASENQLIQKARQITATYESAQSMIRAGFYTAGADKSLDEAVQMYPEIETFMAQSETGTVQDSFQKLSLLFRRQPPSPAAATSTR